MTMDVAEVGGTWSVLVGDTSRRSYEVTFGALTAGALRVHVNGHAFDVAVTTSRFGGRSRGPRPHAQGDAQGALQIVAPMPGRIVKVLVAPGDTVALRQALVVVEAMKMENELRAPRAGIIRDVRVVEGALVEANVVLAVME